MGFVRSYSRTGAGWEGKPAPGVGMGGYITEGADGGRVVGMSTPTVPR